MSTTAQINSKGTKGTGITDAIAKTLHDNLGKTITIVAEVRSESRGENLKGDETVKLAIQNLEVIPEDLGAADHVREIAKTAHYNRKVAEEGAALDYEGDGPAPKVADVLAAGQRFAPHPFTPVDASAENPICDICGVVDPDRKLAQHLDRSTLDDPFQIPDDGDDPDEPSQPDDPSYEPHEFVDAGEGECATDCGQPEDAPIHQDHPEPETT